MQVWNFPPSKYQQLLLLSSSWPGGGLGVEEETSFPDDLRCHSVGQAFLTLFDPCSLPGFPVLHYLPEFAQTHVC